MARARRSAGQQQFVFRMWGGKRKRAGRKQVNEIKSQPHRRRLEVHPNQAAHVTLRAAPYLRQMRRLDAYRAVRKALLVVLARSDFRVVHVSIQRNHIHLVVEASSKFALARGMQAFQISAARRLNQVDLDGSGRPRRGPVFADRYHAELVSTPTHARHTLSYVLNNWRKHKEDRAPHAAHWRVDKYSSAISFAGWAEGYNWMVPEDHEPLRVAQPESWLLREGWKLGGGPISIHEVPGTR
jgi:REP element-mobilizing transposase RayT